MRCWSASARTSRRSWASRLTASTRARASRRISMPTRSTSSSWSWSSRTATASAFPTSRRPGSSSSGRPRTSSQHTPPRPPPEPLATLASLLEDLPDDLERQAFTHSSWVEQRWRSYERIAFLGDAVLSLAISTHLYPRFEDYGAGRLTKLRAQAVSRQACAEVARELGLPDRLREAAPAAGGRNAEVLVESDRILASICEAVIGAAYLAFGFERVAPAVVRAFEEQIAEALEHPVDYKSVLQARRGKDEEERRAGGGASRPRPSRHRGLRAAACIFAPSRSRDSSRFRPGRSSSSHRACRWWSGRTGPASPTS